ncbi:hypothetical protein HDU80_004075 [Chytriomyces hyalinus]|nr:hypothetical protein HDU80_004075 [Chytriomyces hyalinus]
MGGDWRVVVTVWLSNTLKHSYLLPFALELHIGPVFMIAGAVLISYLDVNSLLVQTILYLFIFGIGGGEILSTFVMYAITRPQRIETPYFKGSMIQTRVLAIQATVPIQLIAIATVVSQKFMTLEEHLESLCSRGTIFSNAIESNVKNYATLSSAAIETLDKSGIPTDPANVLALVAKIHGSPILANVV